MPAFGHPQAPLPIAGNHVGELFEPCEGSVAGRTAKDPQRRRRPAGAGKEAIEMARPPDTAVLAPDSKPEWIAALIFICSAVCGEGRQGAVVHPLIGDERIEQREFWLCSIRHRQSAATLG
jgi:hypothetical protein